MKHKITATLSGVALALSLSFAGASPATADINNPSPTSVTPTLGMAAGAYAFWCNMYGHFCYKDRFYNRAGGYWFTDICSNWICTERYHSSKHPPLSKAQWY